MNEKNEILEEIKIEELSVEDAENLELSQETLEELSNGMEEGEKNE